MRWYYKFLARRPFLMVLGIGVFSLACITVSFTTKKLPDFSDATAGFEARGTAISQRLTAWRNLLEETKVGGKLVADPNDIFLEQDYYNAQHHEHKNKKHKKKKTQKTNKKKFKEKMKELKDYARNDTKSEGPSRNLDANDTFEFGRHTYGIDEDDNREMIESSNTKWMSLRNSNPPIQEIVNVGGTAGFFCGEPMKEYSHMVIQRSELNKNDSKSSLFDIDYLLGMCNLELEMQKINLYDEFCEKQSNSCCRPWSLPNYIALLSNKSSCLEIDKDDVSSVQNLLLSCHVYYINMKLSNDCEKYRCFAPVECTRHDAIYNIFHYLADMNFIKLNATSIYLSNAMLFLPIARSQSVLPLFREFEKKTLANDYVEIVAIDMGLKNVLFDECLKVDFWLLLLGATFVMFSIWIYTSSLFVTFMTLLLILFSLGIAYFVYMLVFEIPFFPFMNVLAAVVIVGIGADEAFIFIKIWRCTTEERIRNSGGGPTLSSPSTSYSDSTHRETLNSLMATTLKHAAVSMLVSSLTTAAAFYASYMTQITAIKCYGIFAGTTIIANYLLMVTWTPASVSIMERIPFSLESCMSAKVSQKLHKSITRLGKLAEDFIINAVVKLSVLWIALLGSLGIVSMVIVLYWPSIQLPDTPDFQLFDSKHPFELYDMKFRDKFWFEKSITSVDNYNLPLRFVWGVKPIDNGNYLDPFSRGELYFDNNFNMSSKESQKWLLEFCKKIKEQQFYQYSFGILMPNCFIENFVSWMNRECFDPMEEVDRSPCCKTSKFPFEPEIFEKCLILSLTTLYATPREFFTPGVAGPKFRRPDFKLNMTLSPEMKALIVEYESNVPYTLVYSDVETFVSEVEKWFSNEMKSAPVGMQNGWFTSELTFFDLQDTLSKGTVVSILISMSISLGVLLFVTLNVLVSFYAVITMTFSIFTTIAILILLGWKLNILESISISTAIGLVVDFSLHYSVHYRLSSSGSRESATIFAMSRMLGPSAMAAITTGAAGAFMMFSTILPYIQIGIFLVIVISLSWIYATLFLMSLLNVIGPQYGFMQFSYPKIGKQRKKKLNGTDFRERKNNTVVSEQLLTPSSSAVGDLINSETHELDSLTSNSVATKPTLNLPEIPQASDYERVFNRIASLSKEYRSPSTGSAVTVVLVDDHDGKI
ncbi:unnamed protein product [Hermetia illucens]|uniref:SSD domain-containing protein n=1 Tax=Hermetia illucens TaxID=343691 RepID=A0A7R8UNZ3_HERIL|nr:protein dispatched isoform X2 [Hermetia illucens]CAD7084344.1 unnamed protein product [Hermetia illucens]